MKITAFYRPADISGCARHALWIGSYETRCLSGQAHAKLAVSRRTRSKLALISWATQPDSQHNRSARTPLLETRIALGYTWRWRVTTSYEECIASLLRVMRVYYEFKRVQDELQRVSNFFWTCSQNVNLLAISSSCAELRRAVPSCRELSRVTWLCMHLWLINRTIDIQEKKLWKSMNKVNGELFSCGITDSGRVLSREGNIKNVT